MLKLKAVKGKCRECRFAKPDVEKKYFYICSLWGSRQYVSHLEWQGCQFSDARFLLLISFFLKNRKAIFRVAKFLISINDKILEKLLGASIK
jgi:hypothetical protein